MNFAVVFCFLLFVLDIKRLAGISSCAFFADCSFPHSWSSHSTPTLWYVSPALPRYDWQFKLWDIEGYLMMIRSPCIVKHHAHACHLEGACFGTTLFPSVSVQGRRNRRQQQDGEAAWIQQKVGEMPSSRFGMLMRRFPNLGCEHPTVSKPPFFLPP